MGDPKFLRRTFERPKHPWEEVRMAEENKLLTKYGLKNKRELWRAQFRLRNYRRQARELQARVRAKEVQAEKETKALLESLVRIGALPVGANTLDDILSLTLDSLLERRLQWIVYVKGLASTLTGARQLIVHGHISVGNHKVRSPGFVVTRDDEVKVAYNAYSPFLDEAHPMRVSIKQKIESGKGAPSAPPASG
jgi:small subunit ribosomal protein S4